VPRIESRDFRLPEGGYADPMLFPRADWRDVYRHDPAGRLTGWDRETPDGTLRFDAAGRLITDTDTDTGPVPVRHVIDRPEGGVPRLRLRKGSGPD
jgi:YD repeat-containing protein